MRPILFRWRHLRIYSYPAMLYLGMIFGLAAQNYAANRSGLNSARVFGATLALLIPALIGARLLYVALHWSFYRREPQRIWRRSEGGAAMFGSVPFVLLFSGPLLYLLEIPFAPFWDVTTFAVLTGSIFTRVGCLLNGCCFGRLTESAFGLCLPSHQGGQQRRIPTPLLDAGWSGLLLVGAVLLWDNLPFSGALFLYSLAGYGLGRLGLEFTRDQHERSRFNRSLHLAVPVTLIIFSVVFGLILD